MTTTKNTNLIYEKMAAIMADATHIGKDQQNKAQGFKYRGIDDVYNTLHKVFAQHGVFVCPEVMEKHREERTNKNGTVLAFTTLRMRYTFYAADGSSVSCIVEGEGMDSGDKSSNKAMAVAHKYALLQTFMIPTDEAKDPDAESHEVQPTVKIDPKVKKAVYEQTLACLENGDEHGLMEVWGEFDPEEKAALWPMFNSQQRSAMKDLMKGSKAA